MKLFQSIFGGETRHSYPESLIEMAIEQGKRRAGFVDAGEPEFPRLW